MKITDVITHQLSVPVDEPFTSSRGWVYKTKGALVAWSGISHRAGWVDVPVGPGLGIDIVRDVLKRYRVA